MLEFLLEMHKKYPKIGFSVIMYDPGDEEGERFMITFVCDGMQIIDPTMATGMTEEVDSWEEYRIEHGDAKRIALINRM